MAEKNNDNADVFVRGEALPFLEGKEATYTADVFVRGEAVGVLEQQLPLNNTVDFTGVTASGVGVANVSAVAEADQPPPGTGTADGVVPLITESLAASVGAGTGDGVVAGVTETINAQVAAGTGDAIVPTVTTTTPVAPTVDTTTAGGNRTVRPQQLPVGPPIRLHWEQASVYVVGREARLRTAVTAGRGGVRLQPREATTASHMTMIRSIATGSYKPVRPSLTPEQVWRVLHAIES